MPGIGLEDDQTTAMTADAAIDDSPVALASADDLPAPVVEGLTRDEAMRRLEEVGPNELVEHRQSGLRRFLASFWGPIPWMIEAAALLSAAVQHWADFAIIGVLLVFNAVVGFWEEFQAGNAIEALQARLAPNARVRRDGAWRVIPARELVPEDLIRLRIGDIVPADATLRPCDPLEVDQSALTGESLPVERGSGGVVYSGSTVVRGEADGVVQSTGAATFFGRTATLVEASAAPSHFQRAVLRIGNLLIVLAAVMVSVIVAVAIRRGEPLVTTLEFALVLTVAAIPVAMPVVLSVTMAVGARLLAAKDAIVSRLAAIEELAGMDVLCTDKTGTLTQNTLTVGEPRVFDGGDPRLAIAWAALASRAEDGDPIDRAVLAAVGDDSIDGATVTHFVPFDPVHKRTEASIEAADGSSFKVSKGAPQVILALVDDSERIADEVDRVIEDLASRGFRSLGVARTDTAGRWQMVAVLPLQDPPREDSKITLQRARQLGVGVKMVTGDQLAIAREIARELDLGDHILNADRLATGVDVEDPVGAREIEAADGFAQVFPEHKYHLVKTLQQLGHIVGMTGDGVNDAPALKRADAGIAVAGATDAARAAADIVLTSPGLSVIIDAIRTSRTIFQRMNSYAIYRIAETIRVLLFMTASILAFNFYPVTAAMIVLLALLNDGPILAIAFDHAHGSDRPEAWNMPRVMGVASVLGLAGVVASFGLFFFGDRVMHLDRATLQSLVFLKLAVAGHLTIFLTRTRGPFWSSMPAPSLLWAAVATKALATLAAVYGVFMVPVGWRWALIVWGYSLAWFVVNDLLKRAAYAMFDRRTRALESAT